ncbi:hypothetical protein BBO99_00001404 [Phytophthora kernoviae]|uniref:Uncharacterized protein n=2 Tax=Phytophthora kernoviae TaxID=325452 RepID=A0A421F691_9STRA|nr:hypothetical protein G195_002178 [Phytophthora kernoviae 00238/432]KAG2530573.1 hypothetical protein JM16_000892 [Phytophthora kernoviae]KAG2531318.1 hypothetical protein JM18_001671 [Phytophthora kernoviae]RLN26177.1 hypothetical protein BBI17_001273 [Phytophthora kernoviae]RLN84343.1 hypothetical protein BBO99_00001404 [Phytophthora kernoviae]
MSNVQELSRRLLKRVRPSLPTTTANSVVEEFTETTTSEALLKVCKRQIESSPRSSMTVVEPLTEKVAISTPSNNSAAVIWPSVIGCDGVRKALTFLQTSRQHALMLMIQNHWERAMSVLEKIEKATESVSEQRRQVVLQQANAGRNLLIEKIKELELTSSVNKIHAASRRAVRFSDEVSIAFVEEMDRKCDEVSEPVREEMLVLRASRKIPHENLSEFWNE